METRTVKSSEIQVGDVVREHGMRVRIDEIHTYPSGRESYPTVYACQGTVLNLDEVREAGIVPMSFLCTDYRWVAGEGHVPARRDHWNVQGNDLARWLVEI